MILKSVDYVTKSGFNTNFVTGMGGLLHHDFCPMRDFRDENDQ